MQMIPLRDQTGGPIQFQEDERRVPVLMGLLARAVVVVEHSDTGVFENDAALIAVGLDGVLRKSCGAQQNDRGNSVVAHGEKLREC